MVQDPEGPQVHQAHVVLFHCVDDHPNQVPLEEVLVLHAHDLRPLEVDAHFDHIVLPVDEQRRAHALHQVNVPPQVRVLQSDRRDQLFGEVLERLQLLALRFVLRQLDHVKATLLVSRLQLLVHREVYVREVRLARVLRRYDVR